MSGKRAAKGLDYFLCAVYVILSFLFEVILILIENIMGIKFGIENMGAVLFHWSLVCVVWAVSGFLIISYAKKKLSFNILERKEGINIFQIIGVIICLLITLFVQYYSWGGFKIVKEFWSLGAVKFLFQYIYYLSEAFLISLVVVFGQKAFEEWFGYKNIPYGGILLALTWGLAHIFTKSSLSTGVVVALLGSFYGIVYLLFNKDYKKSLLVIFLLFIL